MIKKLCLLVVFLSLTTLAFAQGTGQSEQITITTYYPSPYGVYKNLRLFPYAGISAGTSCSSTNKQGDLAYSLNTNQPLYCNGTTWMAMGGGGGASYTYYCFTNSTSTHTYGTPACPASVSIGTQGPCASGFIVKRALGHWGYCWSNCSGCSITRFSLPPGGSCGYDENGHAYSTNLVGNAYVCSQ